MTEKQIRIVHLMATPAFSGPDATVLSLFEKLNHQRYRNYLIFLKSPGTVNQLLVDRSRELGIESVSFPTRGKLNPVTLGRIVSFIRYHRIDILHPHNYKTDILAFLASRFYHSRRVSTLHGFVERSRKMKMYKRMDLALLRRFDRVKVVSEPLLRQAAEAGISPARISLIPNAIDLDLMVCTGTERESLRKEFGLEADQPAIGMVGRLDREKNPGMLLAALPELLVRFPGLKCFFVGEGALKKSLTGRAREMGLGGAAIFTGYREDARNIISLLDVVVMPSLTEGIPKTLLESLAFKKPVVAAAVGGIPDVIVDGENGFLIPSGDGTALIERVTSLLNNPSLCRQLGEAGYSLVVAEYSDRRMVAQMETFYEEALM
jgi:glycosyltransferase involved in cell wall biosynthesis